MNTKLDLHNTEKWLEKTARRRIKASGVATMLKFVSPGLRGVPDNIVHFVAGPTFYIEFKSLGQKPAPHQVEVIRELQKFVPVVVIDSEATLDKLTSVLTSIQSGRYDFISEVVEEYLIDNSFEC